MKFVFLIILLLANFVEAKECQYPADPINWILRYCSYEISTDDEVAIQGSACFKAAQKDLGDSNKCKMNEKYKAQICKKFLMKSKKYSSKMECLKDPSIKPFFAGG